MSIPRYKQFLDDSILLEFHGHDLAQVFESVADKNGYFLMQREKGYILNIYNLSSLKQHKDNYGLKDYTIGSICHIHSRLFCANWITPGYLYYSYENKYITVLSDVKVLTTTARVFTKLPPKEYVCKTCLKKYDIYETEQLVLNI
jgi:hypothetical protein